jgi:GAF domain-containing protein/anti-sigma regulatory factor (Ser/Thr protein kinase)
VLDVQHIIVQGACELGFQRARLWLEEPQDTLVGTCQTPNLGMDHFSGLRMHISESPYAKQAISQRRPSLFHGRELGNEPFDQPLVKNGFEPPAGEWLYVPLWAGEQCQGVLTLDNVKQLTKLKPYQTELVYLYSRQAAAALERAHFFETGKRNAERLKFLHQINSELMKLLSEKEDWFWHATLTVATADYGLGFNRAFLFIEENNLCLHGRISIGSHDHKKAFRDWERDLARRMTFERYLRNLRSGRIKPFAAETLFPNWSWDLRLAPKSFVRRLTKNSFIRFKADTVNQLPREISEPLNLTDCALLPLRLGNQIKGILIVDNVVNGEPLLDANLNHLSSLLTQAILIWDNHRQRDALNDLINLNYTIMAQVSNQSLKNTLEQVVRAVRYVSHADYVAIYPLKPGIRPFEYDLTHLAFDSDGIQPDGMVYPRSQGITSYILHTGTLAVPDISKDKQLFDGKRLETHPFISRSNIHALIGTRIQDVQTSEPYGVLYVDYRTPHEFKEQDIHQVTSFASLASVAICNARAAQVAQAAQTGLVARDDELRILQKVLSDSLSAGMKEEDVLRTVLKAAQDLLTLPSVRVGLFLTTWESSNEPEVVSREIRQEYYLNQNSLISHKEYNVSLGLSGEAVLSGDTQLVHDRNDPRWTKYPFLDKDNWLAEMDIPIKPTDSAPTIGVFHITSHMANVFNDYHRKRIERLASATALALDNVRRQKNLHNVLMATKSVIAPLGLEDTLKAIIITGKAIAPGLSALTIWYHDPCTDRIKLGPHFGVWKKTALELVETDPQSVVSRVMNRTTPLFATDVLTEPLLRGRFSQEEEIHSVAAFPLQSDKGIVGAMFFNYRQLHEFTTEEQDLFQLLAEIVALSLRDAAHLELVRKQRDRFHIQVEITDAVGTTFDLSEILRRILIRLVDLFQKAQVTPCVLTFDRIEQELVFEPASLEFYRITNPEYAWLKSVSIDGASIVSAVARESLTQRQVIKRNVPDTSGEPSYLRLRYTTQSEFCITLMSGENLLGVLALESTKPAAFGVDEEELIEVVAQQISLALARAHQAEDLGYKNALLTTTAWAADIAHDLKDEIGNIRHATYDLIQIPSLAIEQRRLVDEIEASAALIHTTVNVALLENQIERQPIFLDQEIQTWVKELTNNRDYVTVLFDLACSDLAVQAHPTVLKRVMRHLVRNALDAANKNPITITIRTRLHKDREIETQVEDNGPGIPKDLQHQLFHVSTTTKGKRRGHGLLFVRSAMESMNGTVRLIRSEPQSATVFAFRIPLSSQSEI